MRKKMENRNPGSLGFLASVLLILWVWMGTQGAAFAVEIPSLSDVSLPPSKADKPAGKNWGRDPFIGPPRVSGGSEEAEMGAPSERGSLNLNAVITRDGEGVAIINNEIVRKGDRILDKRVVDIRRDRVILQDEAGTMELKVDPPRMGR